jgi:hypothetical protein
MDDYNAELDEYDARIDERLKRPRIELNRPNHGYLGKQRTILALLFMGILFIGAMVLVSLKFGSEAEQVQAVDLLFTQ